MTKIEFLLRLEKHLSGLPEADLMRTIDYYNEIIDDRTEDMGSEAEAVAAMGAPEDVAAQVLSDCSLPKLVVEKIKPHRKIAAWEIVLLVLGSPIWFSLLIAAFSVAISVYATVFAVVISLFASSVACGGVVLGSIVSAICFFVEGNWLSGLFYLGLLLICVGLAIYLWYLAVLLGKAIIRLTKMCVLGIKRKLAKKEA